MAYITCPSCNKRITDKMPFCRFCGKAHGVTPASTQKKTRERTTFALLLETREVTTERWENYCRCVICGKTGSEQEFKTTKTKWS